MYTNPESTSLGPDFKKIPNSKLVSGLGKMLDFSKKMSTTQASVKYQYFEV